MSISKKPIIKNTNTSVTGTHGKFFPRIEYKNNPGLMNIVDLKNLTKEPNRGLEVTFNDNGDSFACVDNNGHLLVFYLQKNRFVNICKTINPTAFCFTEKNQGLLFVALPNKNINVYNLAGKQIHELKGHKNIINGLELNHTRNILVSYSHDVCILWDLNTFRPYKLMHSKRFGYSFATFSPDGDSLITLTQDSTTCFTSISNLLNERTLNVPSYAKTKQIAISVESRYLVAGGSTRLIYVFDLSQTGEKYKTYELPSQCEGIKDFKFIENSRLVILGSDNEVYFIDFANNKKVAFIKNVPGKAIVSFDVDIYGRYLIVVVNSGETYLYDLKILQEKSLANQTNPALNTFLKQVEYDRKPETATMTVNNDTLRTPFQESTNIMQPTHDENKKTTTFMYKSYQSHYNPRMNESMASTSTNKENQRQTLRAAEPLYKTAKIDLSKSLMNQHELTKYLKKLKSFPEKHRSLIWRFLLELPLNNEAYDNLCRKGVHKAFHNLQRNYPLTNNRLVIKMQRILSSLANYSPVFAEVKFLPDFIFPFVKLFENEELVCFEVLLSFFLQWGQNLFESHPAPPFNVFKSLEELLKFHEPELFAHIQEKRINIKALAWISFQNLFTDILTKQDWLALMDFLILNCHEPIYILHFLTAYFAVLQEHILKADYIDSIEFFIKKQSSINIGRLTERMEHYLATTPSDILFVAYNDNLPLSSKQYPIYNFYPKYTQEEREKIKERIFQQDQMAQAQRDQIQQIQILSEEVRVQEKNLQERALELARRERDRKELKAYEDDMRLQQKLSMEKESREKRVAYMKTIENSIKNSVVKQGDTKLESLVELEREIQKKSKFDSYIIQSKLEEEALQNLEFQTVQKLNEMIEHRHREEKIREAEIGLQNQERLHELQHISLTNKLNQEDEEYRLKVDLLKGQKSLEENLQREAEHRKDIQYTNLMEEFERNLKLQDIENERRIRRIAEEERFKDDEFMKVYTQHQIAIKGEEDKQLNQLVDEERQVAIKKAQERLAILERERKLLKYESEDYRNAKKAIDEENKRNEFETQLLDLRRQNERLQLEEERRLQMAIRDIDEERRAQREAQQETIFREREDQEHHRLEKIMRENEQTINQEERDRFENFQETVSGEMHRADEFRDKFANSGYYDNSIESRDVRSMHENTYSGSYLEGTNYSNEQGLDSFNASRSQELRSRIYRNPDEVRIEDQSRRDDGQRTGTFHSPNMSGRNFGKSFSSYTYSDTVNGENGRRYETGARTHERTHESPIREAREIISRHHHQQGRSIDESSYKTFSEDTSRADFISPKNNYDTRNYGKYSGDMTSNEKYYRGRSETSKSPTLQSSPNLTYSSPGGSAQKSDWQFYRDER